MASVSRRETYLFVMAAVWLCACGSDALTQLIVVVHGDLAKSTDLDRIRVRVLDRDAVEVTEDRELRVGPDGDVRALPFSFGIVPTDERRGDAFRLVVDALSDDGGAAGERLISRYQVLVSFRSAHTTRLDVELSSTCALVVCGGDDEVVSDEVCRPSDGSCQPIEWRRDLPAVEPGEELEGFVD